MRNTCTGRERKANAAAVMGRCGKAPRLGQERKDAEKDMTAGSFERVAVRERGLGRTVLLLAKTPKKTE